MYHIISRFLNRKRMAEQIAREDRVAAINAPHTPRRSSQEAPSSSSEHIQSASYDDSNLRSFISSLSMSEKRALRVTWSKICGRHGRGGKISIFLTHQLQGVVLCEKVIERVLKEDPNLRAGFHKYT